MQPSQFRAYIKKFVEIVVKYQNTNLFGKFKTFQTSAEYERIISDNQFLSDMATEPFTIRLLVGVMPDLKEILAKRSPLINLSMLEIIESFVNKWIENEISRFDREEGWQLSEFVDVDEDKLLSPDNVEGVIYYINLEALKIIKHLWVTDKISKNKFDLSDISEITDAD